VLLVLLTSAILMTCASGCWTNTVMNRANGYIAQDSMHSVESAYVADDQDLLICGKGMIKGRWVEFWLRVPIEAISGGEERGNSLGYKLVDSRIHPSRSHNRAWIIPRRNMTKAPCKPRRSDAITRLPVRTVEYSPDRNGDVPMDFRAQPAPRVVYLSLASSPRDNTLGQARLRENGTPAEITFFRTAKYRAGRRPLWYLVMPAALAGDALLLPVYILFDHWEAF
jgi:hypothetical protein